MVKFDDSLSNRRIANLYAKEEERLVQTMASQLGFEYIDLRGQSIDPDALAAIPKQKSKDAEMVGFAINNHKLSIAIRNPNQPKTQALIQELQALRYIVSIFICSSASLKHAQERYSDIVDSSAEKSGVFEISPEDITRLTEEIKQKEDVDIIRKRISKSNSSRRISETLELIFAGGIALGVSDVHIEPEETGIRLRYRFDGVLNDIADLDSYIYKRLTSRLKLLSGMVLNAKARAQDGRFTFDTGDRKVEVRTSIIPGTFGESIVIRLLDPSVASFSLDKIRLNPYIKEAILQQLKKPNGLIATTGPTGSGKTTSIYTFLKATHSEGVKIITLENPVEYKLDGIVQTQTSEDYTFASGLRAVLRQDPDIIMVGEIRDEEVAETAIHAAQTGHLVFTTLHTNSAVASFSRLVDLGVDPRIMGNAINIIIGQRLLRLLCNDCKKKYEASAEEKQLIDFVMSSHPHPIPVPEPLMLFQSVGCDNCNGTGYRGRIGVYEGILMDKAVEEAVLQDLRAKTILDAAKPQGIPTMSEDGIVRLLEGITSIKELKRVLNLPNQGEYMTPIITPEISTDETKTKDDDFLSHVV
ncbi:MAG: type IV pilus assembly protein PilB [Candidatus Paceibacteria bacterium]|jgi:type IV pilus assembly protein PilB